MNHTPPTGSSPYSRKLNDPRWLLKKAAVLQRDGNKCRHCTTTDRHLQVRYVAHRGIAPWEYPEEELETICVDCSAQRTEIFDDLFNRVRVMLKDCKTDDLPRIVRTLIHATSLTKS